MIRVMAAGIVSGASLTHTLSKLPNYFSLTLFGLLFLCSVLILRWRLRRLIHKTLFNFFFNTLVLLSAAMCGMTWTVFLADARLQDALSVSHENVVTRLTFRIDSLSQDQSDQQRVEVSVQNPTPQGVPRRLLVSWQDPPNGRTVILPGQHWRAALILRRPHGASNPSGFDYEAHMFQKNIRALAKVRGQPTLLADQPFASLGVMVSRLRHHMRAAMRHTLGDARYGAVLIALAIGDQDSVSSADWEVFNRTGITHLVSISGSHVTMLAAFGGLSMLWIWKRMRLGRHGLAERIPAKLMASMAALIVAWMYCLLAGWGVPARRTFFMLLVIGVTMMARVPISSTSVVCLAAAVVTLMDPWSPLATGFWLSFGAVLILFAVGKQAAQIVSMHPKMKYWFILKESARIQWLITVAMTPVLAYLFHQISLISPFANAIAIPVVTFIVTPLALLNALFAILPGGGWIAFGLGWLANFAMQGAMYPISWLSEAPWAMWPVTAMPFSLLVVSTLGVLWALQPPGIPVRWAGWCLLLPALVWRPERPALGEWKLLAMDVGQGSAILISTRHHDLLFDTGARLGATDAGQRVILPVLRSLGIRKLDTLFISHADIDHSGGLLSVMQALPVAQRYASFDVQQWVSRQATQSDAYRQASPHASQHASQQAALQPAPSLTRTASLIALPAQDALCERGQQWEWDGVVFSVLHPQKASAQQAERDSLHPAYVSEQIMHQQKENPIKENQKKVRRTSNSSNANSCVLHIAGMHHRALLTGDIGSKEEAALIAAYPDLQADVVVAAHHGSATSSSLAFVHQLQASQSIAQLGFLNRFKHPDPVVSKRWLDAGAIFWRTDWHGAVEAQSTLQQLNMTPYRQARLRYWHHHSE